VLGHGQQDRGRGLQELHAKAGHDGLLPLVLHAPADRAGHRDRAAARQRDLELDVAPELEGRCGLDARAGGREVADRHRAGFAPVGREPGQSGGNADVEALILVRAQPQQRAGQEAQVAVLDRIPQAQSHTPLAEGLERPIVRAGPQHRDAFCPHTGVGADALQQPIDLLAARLGGHQQPADADLLLTGHQLGLVQAGGQHRIHAQAHQAQGQGAEALLAEIQGQQEPSGLRLRHGLGMHRHFAQSA
jgi:hypothetical protein